MDFNKVILVGRLTRDTEFSVLPSQTGCCQFGLAIGRQWKDKQTGQPVKETTFVDCTAFGKQAENIHKYFTKGSPILIEGRLKLDQWQDKQTQQNRTKLKVIIERFEFVIQQQQDPQQPLYDPQAAPQAQAGLSTSATVSPPQQPAYEPPDIPTDNIPF